MKKKTFEIKVDKNSFCKSDILMNVECTRLEVLEKPYRKWYRLLFQIITFGLYKAPWQYKVKLIPTKDE